MSLQLATAPSLPRYERSQIEARLRRCPRLPSLGSVNSALRDLLSADHRYTSQIAEVIRRDPSLTERLLRLVNSVYYGFSTPVHSIEEAVFFLGVRQIRQLAMMTPVIEDLQRLPGSAAIVWHDFWRHCIGTAILAREVTSAFAIVGEEAEYVAGLVHDVGKIIMASVFAEHFAHIRSLLEPGGRSLCEVEEEVLGIDHAALGALYLQDHKLPEVLIEVTRFHHHPGRATRHRRIVAAVHVADCLVRRAGIGESGNFEDASGDAWLQIEGWEILCERRTRAECVVAEAGLLRSVNRLPGQLEGLV